MTKAIIHTEKAPATIGAYSQAVRAGNTVYMSGQIPLDPVSMNIVGDGDFRAETHQVFKNLQAVAEAAGGSLEDIVKINAYLTDLDGCLCFFRTGHERNAGWYCSCIVGRTCNSDSNGIIVCYLPTTSRFEHLDRHGVGCSRRCYH